MDASELPVKLSQTLLEFDYDRIRSVDRNKCLRDNLLGIVDYIPVIGTWMAKAIESGISYSDASLFRKVFLFIYGIKDTTQEERQSFVQEIESTANDVSGNVICDMINRLDNINKADILANLMKAKINGEIDILDFFRLTSVCEKIPYPDLQYLGKFADEACLEGGVTELLYSSGALIQRTIGEDQNTYTLSVVGRKLLKYGMLVDVDTVAKNATYVPSLGMEDTDKNIEQMRDDEAMFELDVFRGK